jgi:hypothetical protein
VVLEALDTVVQVNRRGDTGDDSRSPWSVVARSSWRWWGAKILQDRTPERISVQL